MYATVLFAFYLCEKETALFNLSSKYALAFTLGVSFSFVKRQITRTRAVECYAFSRKV